MPRNALPKNLKRVPFGIPETNRANRLVRTNLRIASNLRIDSRELGHLRKKRKCHPHKIWRSPPSFYVREEKHYQSD